MKAGSTHTLLIMPCAGLHMPYTCSLLALSALALSVSLTHAGFPISPWLTSKRTPIPLKVPFSLVLMADRLWPHSLSAAACTHCVPLSESSVWVEDRLALQSECLTWMYGLGVYPITKPNYHPPATPSCHIHTSLRGGESEMERDTDWEYLWHSDACLTLEEANHRIEVLRMIGYRLSERGEVALNANPFLIKIGSI